MGSSLAGVISHCKGDEEITDLSSAVGLTVPNGAVFALIQAQAQHVRFTTDGTPPTASYGMRLASYGTLEWDGDLTKLLFIEETSGAGLFVIYFGI